MVRLIIYTTIILLIITKNLNAQHEEKILNLERQIRKSKIDSTKSALHWEKIVWLCKEDSLSISSLQREASFINTSYFNSEKQDSIYWAKAVIAYLNNLSSAQNEMINYLNIQKRINLNAEILCLAMDVKFNNNTLHKFIKDTSLLNLYFSFKSLPKRKFQTGAGIFSAILPGSGMFIKGYPKKAMGAFILNTSSIIFTLYLLKNNLYMNAATWGANSFVRFYLGNIMLTNKLKNKKNYNKYEKEFLKSLNQLELLLNHHKIEILNCNN